MVENEFNDEEINSQAVVENTSERVSLDENNISQSKIWFKLPSESEVGTKSESFLIKDYYKQPSVLFKDKNGEECSNGLKRKDGKYTEAHYLVNSKDENINVTGWELFYKLEEMRKYCKETNQTFLNQEIIFNRVNKGRANFPKNWVIEVPKLKIKIVGNDLKQNEVVDLK